MMVNFRQLRRSHGEDVGQGGELRNRKTLPQLAQGPFSSTSPITNSHFGVYVLVLFSVEERLLGRCRGYAGFAGYRRLPCQNGPGGAAGGFQCHRDRDPIMMFHPSPRGVDMFSRWSKYATTFQ